VSDGPGYEGPVEYTVGERVLRDARFAYGDLIPEQESSASQEVSGSREVGASHEGSASREVTAARMRSGAQESGAAQ